MRICSTNTECADTSSTRYVIGLPFRPLAQNLEWTIFKIEVRIGILEMKGWRKYAVSNDMRSIDQAGYTCSDVEVSDVCLCRSDRAKLASTGPRAKCLRQARQFDRITKRCPGSVSFDVADRF